MTGNRDGRSGNLALLLHTHLPYVRNLEPYVSLEEKWLFEALTESYIPLVQSWERLAAEGVNFKLNLSLSPTLISMLIDSRLPERYGGYLTRQMELAGREVERTANNPVFRPLAEFYEKRFNDIYRTFIDSYQGNLIYPLKRLYEQGYLEIITTCATHGYLPLILTDESRRAQVRIALGLFQEVFGRLPAGIWLPECGYTPGIENILREQGIQYFVISTHGMLNAVPPVSTAVYAPIKVGGVAVFGRDWETSYQVWSRTEGYPGDFMYREFYRDIGYDLDFNYLEPYLVGGIRSDTGFKYYRITGKDDSKEPYDYNVARQKAREHAANFLFNRDRQLEYWAQNMPDRPVVTAPYDTELFGHWWFEGPDWLEDVLRLASGPDYRTRLTTFSSHLEKYPPRHEAIPISSSWGEGGYNRVWLNPTNDWVYPHLHRAENTMRALAVRAANPDPLQERILNQAARELLLSQSSDWLFILTTQTMVEYARSRIENHIKNFLKLCRDFNDNAIDEDFLERIETEDNIFPNIDYRVYRPSYRLPQIIQPEDATKPVVMMLSWEFPPHHVGGLGIHVRDLSEALVRMGVKIHVLTLAHGNEVYSAVKDGIYIHYLPTFQQPEKDIDFLSWVLQLNMAMGNYARELISHSPPARLILHAHDWLVAFAAGELQEALKIPLVVTIHATEYGRNNGLHNEIQRSIHRVEGELANKADRVITCSRYMKKEVMSLFNLPETKIRTIPNAVKPINLAPVPQRGQTILFVGRLVAEKGVQVLLASFKRLSESYPEAKLIIAGAGPYADFLKELAARLEISERVEFTGFVSEKVRNQLLARCDVAVFPSLYEPFGIVTLEAMAAGVPVIVSRTGGLAEVVEDGVTGLSFTPGDIEGLHRCLVTVFQDLDRIRKISKRGQARVHEYYTWEPVARQTLELYQDVIQEKYVNNKG